MSLDIQWRWTDVRSVGLNGAGNLMQRKEGEIREIIESEEGRANAVLTAYQQIDDSMTPGRLCRTKEYAQSVEAQSVVSSQMPKLSVMVSSRLRVHARSEMARSLSRRGGIEIEILDLKFHCRDNAMPGLQAENDRSAPRGDLCAETLLRSESIRAVPIQILCTTHRLEMRCPRFCEKSSCR